MEPHLIEALCLEDGCGSLNMPDPWKVALLEAMVLLEEV